MLGVQGWQETLLHLSIEDSEGKCYAVCVIAIKLFPDSDSLHSLVYQLFHTVLMYAIREEEEGWRLWTQTAAAIHAFVSHDTSIT